MINKREYWTNSLTPQRLWTIFFIQLSEGYQLNVILPFVVFMIRDFGFSENSVGTFAGLLTATFAFCQFISSYFWGWFSDYYGRKIALYLGLFASAAAIIVFGTSQNYTQAVLARGIAGIFNGNIGVARAYIADISDSHNRSFAFSIFAIAFSGGIILGSTAGGVLIQSFELDEDGGHKQSESILKWWVFETKYPYLLPCVFGACIAIFAFILCGIYVEDVKKNKKQINPNKPATKSTSYTELVDDISMSQSKSLPMMSMGGASYKKSVSKNRDDWTIGVVDKHQSMTLNNYDDLIEVSIIESNIMGTNALHDVIKLFKSVKPEKNKLLDKNASGSDSSKIETLSDLLFKTKLIHALVINSNMMLMLVAWNAMVPLLMAQTLEFDSTEIGIQMAFCGVVLFVFTWWLQPPLMKKFNYKPLYIVCGSTMLCVILAFPSIAIIPNINDLNKWLLLTIVSIVGSLKFAFSTNLVVLSFCFLNNSVPKQSLGRANGLGQSLAAGLRGLGPLVGGSLWSWSMTLDSQFAIYIAYVFMAVPTGYSVIHCWCFISNDIQKVYEEQQKTIPNQKRIEQQQEKK